MAPGARLYSGTGGREEALMSEPFAGAEEVLCMITGIMRGDCADESGAGPKIAERFRAAELLAKRYGLLEDAAGAGCAVSPTCGTGSTGPGSGG